MITENQTQEKEPSRDEVIAWYKSQIELAGYRAELAELQAKAVKAEAERIQAGMFLAQMDAAQKQMDSEETEEQPAKENVRSLKRT